MAYKDKDKQREYQRKWKSKRREKWLKENGPCVICGSWINLEVDHIDPKHKVSHKIWSWSRIKREEELLKCQILCRLCHVEKTNKDRKRKKEDVPKD